MIGKIIRLVLVYSGLWDPAHNPDDYIVGGLVFYAWRNMVADNPERRKAKFNAASLDALCPLDCD